MTDPSTGETSRLLLRPLLDAEEHALAAKHTGRRVKLRAANGAVEQQVDLENMRSLVRARALEAWLDTQNVAVTAGDAESAAAYSAFVGWNVTVGGEVVLDGQLDKRATVKVVTGIATVKATAGTGASATPVFETREMSLKEYVLLTKHAVAVAICELLAEASSVDREEESGKGTT